MALVAERAAALEVAPGAVAARPLSRSEPGQVGPSAEALHRRTGGRRRAPARLARPGTVAQGGDEPGHEGVSGAGWIDHLHVGELEQLAVGLPCQ